ncbi:SusC/RagA family TonB-linked outer membrane protein [Marinilabiliaceae bacterium JC040]|nr:SusC/RagA family TonB-linked outer membrane protein [Marinilabiliaceae bacterium JC040]
MNKIEKFISLFICCNLFIGISFGGNTVNSANVYIKNTNSNSIKRDSLCSYVLKGRIIDKNTKTNLVGVSVSIENTSIGCMSNSKGEFALVLNKGQKIIISCIGYKTKTIKPKKDFILVCLEEKHFKLDEVVVRARTNVNDIDMREKAGAVEIVNIDIQALKPELDISMALQGQVPGLLISQPAELGQKPKIRIRGTASFRKNNSANEPLFVLDGMIISSDAFHTLNIEDISEIKVLKDAAATALYGVKAANGVIEMVSKRGHIGKTQIVYRNKTGITFRGNRGAKMMDSKEKLELERLIQNPALPGYRFSEDYYRRYYSNDPNLKSMIAKGKVKLDSLSNINTDWFKELTRMNLFQSHSLGIRGGTDKSQYYYSVNYSKQGGKVKGNDIERFTGRINLDYSILSNLQVYLNLSGGVSKLNTPNGVSESLTSLIYKLNSYEKKKSNGNKLYSYPTRTYSDLINQYSSESNQKRIESSININWKINKDLDISAVYGMDYTLNENLSIINSNAYSQRNVPDDAKGKISKYKNTDFNYSSNVRAQYLKTIDKHDIAISANTDYYYTAIDNIGIAGHGIASKMKSAAGINQALEDNYKPKISSMKQKYAQVGIGASAAYTFDSLYELYGSYKLDASSLMPKDKRWNKAWSLGLGWNISKYSLLKNLDYISDIKLRASYGRIANISGISASSIFPIYSYEQSVYNGKRLFSLSEYYNTDLKPEQTISTNIGCTFNLFNKLNVNLNLYRNKTVDAIIGVPIPISNGYPQLNRNVGVLENKGYEICLNSKIYDNNNLRIYSSISISYNKNTVLDLYDGDKLYLNENSMIPEYEVGKPIGIIYGLKSLGINSIDGLPRYQDSNGNEFNYKKNIKTEDFRDLGYSTPPYTGFFNNSLSYKSFDLSIDIYFNIGGKAQFSRSFVRRYSDINYNAVKGQTLDMWFKQGDMNKIYHKSRIPAMANDILRWPTNKTIYSTDMLKINNIRLSYRLEKNFLKKNLPFIQYANVNVQLQNILSLRRAEDKASLNGVQQPILMLGLNLTF